MVVAAAEVGGFIHTLKDHAGVKACTEMAPNNPLAPWVTPHTATITTGLKGGQHEQTAGRRLEGKPAVCVGGGAPMLPIGESIVYISLPPPTHTKAEVETLEGAPGQEEASQPLGEQWHTEEHIEALLRREEE